MTETYSLKKWINLEFIEGKKGLLSNSRVESLYIALSGKPIDLQDWKQSYEDTLILNSNPVVVETILKKIWNSFYNYKREIFACNTSPEVVKWCVEYFYSVINNDSNYSPKNLSYDSEGFLKWVDFCRNLSRNPTATNFMIEFLQTQDKLDLPTDKNQFINIHTVFASCKGGFLNMKPENVDFVKKKILDGTVNINEVVNISDLSITNLVLQMIGEVNFTGKIIKNTNDILIPHLLENRGLLDIYFCITDKREIVRDIALERLGKGEPVKWERIWEENIDPRFNGYISTYYSAIGWEKCKIVSILEKNIEKISDLKRLDWNIISYNPSIFEVVPEDKCEDVDNNLYSLYNDFTSKLVCGFDFFK